MNTVLLMSVVGVVILAVAAFAVTMNRLQGTRATGVELRMDGIERRQQGLDSMIRDELARSRNETGSAIRDLTGDMKNFSDAIVGQMTQAANLQLQQLGGFTNNLTAMSDGNEKRLNEMRATVEARLKDLQTNNTEKLDKIRSIVDRELHDTLEKRIGESFRNVSERLEEVHRGLGEMRHLASSVGDLRKVLVNVKTRGTLGEIQLGHILEEILTPQQYEKNIVTRLGSGEYVEYAVKLPGKDEDGSIIWLPIDAKFPVEDFQRLLDAYELGDRDKVEEAAKRLEADIKGEAKKIRDKYIDPPHTTDFAVMFLPAEGLYAEVLRRIGLFESIQREYHVIISGPSTLAAILNSLAMGFNTLAIERRSAEIWKVLGAVKTEFGRFADILARAQKKIDEAGKSIECASKKTRTIQRRLKNVQELQDPAERKLLGFGDDETDDDATEEEELK